MTKLHEILAIEADKEGKYQKMLDEAQTTFTKRADHFLSHSTALSMYSDDHARENREDFKPMVTTVPEKLEYVEETIKDYFDILASKEYTNRATTADVTINGVAILSDVPVGLLLGLEHRLKKVRHIYEVIPTLNPSVEWDADETTGKHVFKAKRPVKRHRTEKTLEWRVMVDATDKHPAQIEKWYADRPIGEIVEQHWSGMISPAEKSKLLGKIDTLIQAVKKARQRANNMDAEEPNVGKALFDFIHGA